MERNLKRSSGKTGRKPSLMAHLRSQSDHIWINNGNISRRVTHEDFKCIYEPQGFVLGRVKKDKKIHD